MHNRRIDKEMAGQRTGIRLEPLPELAPEPAPFPAAQAVRDRVPASKRRWQVTPGRSRTGEVQNGFDEHPIAEHWGTPGTGFDGSKDGGNLCPCRISQQQPMFKGYWLTVMIFCLDLILKVTQT